MVAVLVNSGFGCWSWFGWLLFVWIAPLFFLLAAVAFHLIATGLSSSGDTGLKQRCADRRKCTNPAGKAMQKCNALLVENRSFR